MYLLLPDTLLKTFREITAAVEARRAIDEGE